ncbi:MAG: short-subunit dehydrogenase [Myxococcota bacterium]|jgi:short-subunit dehydrogenase
MHTVIITGASSGLGAGLAREFASRGYAVGVLARREPELKGVVKSIEKLGGKAAYRVGDVTDKDGLASAIASLETELGTCDLLIANAGGGEPMPVSAFNPDLISRMMRVNYDGTVNAIAAVLPAMMARGSGHIAATSSLASYRGLAPGGPYSAAKAAVSTLMESLSVELRPQGIAVTTIHPGFVRTPGTADNAHPMPFLMDLDDACRTMANGLAQRRREVNFPWTTASLMRAVRQLPRWFFEPLLKRAAKL